MDFGFTNDDKEYERIVAFRESAITDGWSCEATYGSEPMDRAASLEKDGFKMMILTRTRAGKYKYEAEISIWGPDRLAITPPKTYSMEGIRNGVSRCGECGATGVETQRVAFANRVCEKCLPAAKKKYEFPGWYN